MELLHHPAWTKQQITKPGPRDLTRWTSRPCPPASSKIFIIGVGAGVGIALQRNDLSKKTGNLNNKLQTCRWAQTTESIPKGMLRRSATPTVTVSHEHLTNNCPHSISSDTHTFKTTLSANQSLTLCWPLWLLCNVRLLSAHRVGCWKPMCQIEEVISTPRRKSPKTCTNFANSYNMATALLKMVRFKCFKPCELRP
jgi:hypothetical protein